MLNLEILNLKDWIRASVLLWSLLNLGDDAGISQMIL